MYGGSKVKRQTLDEKDILVDNIDYGMDQYDIYE